MAAARAEVALLVLLGFGVAGLVLSARPGTAKHLGMAGGAILTVGLATIAIAGVFAARLKGAVGSTVLGTLAGLSFGGAAVDSRILAGMHSWHGILAHPLLYLLFSHALVGQMLLGMAMQRGSTTAAVAAMDAASTVPAAIIGLVMLGDQIWPGRQWLAATGFVCTLVAVIGLSRYARPQHAAPAVAGTPPLPPAWPVQQAAHAHATSSASAAVSR